jgi:hypothetical protein
LAHQSRQTERLLGKTGRMIAHYLAGSHPVDESVAIIVRLLVILCQAGASPTAIDARLQHTVPRPRGRKRKSPALD